MKSANNGYADAQYVCGMNHLSGVNGFEKSDNKAVKLLFASAERINGDSSGSESFDFI